MKLHYLKSICTISFIVILGCKTEQKTTSENFSKEEVKNESKKINTFFKNQFDAYMDRHPMMQSYLGITKNADKWEDLSSEFHHQEVVLLKEALTWLQDSIKVNALDENSKLSYDLFKQDLENRIADDKYKYYEYLVNQMHGMQSEIPAFLINMHQIKEKKDAENYISRLYGIKTLFNQLIENLKENEKAGILIPKFVFTKVLEDSKNIIKGKPFDTSTEKSTLFNDFETKLLALNLKEDENNSLIEEAKKALKEGVLIGYTNLIETLEEQEKRATTDDGVWK